MNQTPNQFQVYPAIHLRQGKVVRFQRGDVSTETIYSTDPIAVAQQWIDLGASWLQIVNIDAAFDASSTNNWDLIKQICQLDVKIQFGGGIRGLNDVEWAIKSGIERVIIGTAAVENPGLMAEAITDYGSDHIVVAIDSSPSGEIKTRGWTQLGGIEAISFGRQMRQLGVTRAVHTTINRDGSMSGPDLDMSAELASLTGLQILVGGGVATYDNIVDCFTQDGISGVIIGRALYDKHIELDRAIKMVERKITFDSALPEWKAEQSNPWSKVKYEIVNGHLQKFIPAHSGPIRILDAGGGNGLDSIPLAQNGHHIDLVDSSQAMLSDAKRLAEQEDVQDQITIHNLDLFSLHRHFSPNSFGLILCHNVIQYLEDIDKLLGILIKLLKPGGTLSIMSVNRYATPYRSAFLDRDLDQAFQELDLTVTRSKIFGAEMNEYTADEVARKLIETGFEIKDHYGIRCIFDFWGDNESKSEPENYAKLRQLELALTDRHPYKLMGRYFQLIARKR